MSDTLEVNRNFHGRQVTGLARMVKGLEILASPDFQGPQTQHKGSLT